MQLDQSEKTAHISVVTRHPSGISAFLIRHFAGKPVGCSLRLLLGTKFEYAGRIKDRSDD